MDKIRKDFDVKDYFNKSFDFTQLSVGTNPLCVFTTPKWKHPSLLLLKEELNGVKSLLNNFDLGEWSLHTKNTDPSSLLKKSLKQNFRVELLTQAWCKFYECLSQYTLIPEPCTTNGFLSSLHLCEAPGAFICALNHYLVSHHHGLHWTWYANSLNPHYEGNTPSQMIPDDRLVKHTLNNWLFGLDGTGDISKFYNYLHLVEHINQKVWLVTADGSIDCMENPGEQESFVSYLHYCEVMIALTVLHEGGNFVIKIFTMFEECTVSLVFLLNMAFQSVSAYKPGTSKGGNSEMYLICRGYKGQEIVEHIWEDLLMPYKNECFPETSMFDLNVLPEEFMLEILLCAKYFMNQQVSIINDNIKCYKDQITDSKQLNSIKTLVTNYYLSLCRMKHVYKNKKLVKGANISWVWYPSNSGSYKHLEKHNTSDFVKVQENIELFHIISGKRIDRVYYSKFCDKGALHKFFTQAQSSTSSLYEYLLRFINKSVHIINSKDFPISPFYAFQRSIFDEVKTNLGKETLIFINVPFITHFLASLVFMLFSVYDDVYLHPCGALILSHPNHVDAISASLTNIHKTYDYFNIDLPFECDIIHIINPRILCDNEFYDFLYQYNSIVSNSYVVP